MDERPTIQLFRHQTDAKDYAPATVIFKEGDPGDLMYAVQAGEFDVHLVVAKTACRLVPVDEKCFTFLVEEAPFFALQVMRIMAHRIRRMLESAF